LDLRLVRADEDEDEEAVAGTDQEGLTVFLPGLISGYEHGAAYGAGAESVVRADSGGGGELGGDFAFLARQKRITIDQRDYFIDLLFYIR
jgi:hypothetical protein